MNSNEQILLAMEFNISFDFYIIYHFVGKEKLWKYLMLQIIRKKDKLMNLYIFQSRGAKILRREIKRNLEENLSFPFSKSLIMWSRSWWTVLRDDREILIIIIIISGKLLWTLGTSCAAIEKSYHVHGAHSSRS